MLLKIRSAIFFLYLALWTTIVGIACIPLLLTFKRTNIALTGFFWASGTLFGLRWICGVKTEVLGANNIPKYPFIIASKHQSAWETVFFLKYFVDPVFILKKELCKIPIYGWYLAPMGMVCIDRNAGVSSIKQTMDGVKQTFNEKRTVVIFPEGTRVKPGEKSEFKPGIVAIHNAFPKTPILPVAVNSGKLWSKDSWVIKPGTIKLKFLDVIEGEFKKKELLNKLQDCINTESNKL